MLRLGSTACRCPGHLKGVQLLNTPLVLVHSHQGTAPAPFNSKRLLLAPRQPAQVTCAPGSVCSWRQAFASGSAHASSTDASNADIVDSAAEAFLAGQPFTVAEVCPQLLSLTAHRICHQAHELASAALWVFACADFIVAIVYLRRWFVLPNAGLVAHCPLRPTSAAFSLAARCTRAHDVRRRACKCFLLQLNRPRLCRCQDMAGAS